MTDTLPVELMEAVRGDPYMIALAAEVISALNEPRLAALNTPGAGEGLKDVANSLRKFGQHDASCPIAWETPIQDQTRCECGLWDAIHAAEALSRPDATITAAAGVDEDEMPPAGCLKCSPQWNSIELCNSCQQKFLEDLHDKPETL